MRDPIPDAPVVSSHRAASGAHFVTVAHHDNEYDPDDDLPGYEKKELVYSNGTVLLWTKGGKLLEVQIRLNEQPSG